MEEGGGGKELTYLALLKSVVIADVLLCVGNTFSRAVSTIKISGTTNVGVAFKPANSIIIMIILIVSLLLLVVVVLLTLLLLSIVIVIIILYFIRYLLL